MAVDSHSDLFISQIEADEFEVSTFAKFRCSRSNISGTHIVKVLLVFKSEAMGLNAEQCYALGMKYGADFCIECLFSSCYTSDVERPKIRVGVFQDGEFATFSLSRLLESRMRDFIEKWPLNLEKRPYSTESVRNLMEVSEQDFLSCCAVLDKFRQNETMATRYLTENLDSGELIDLVEEYLHRVYPQLIKLSNPAPEEKNSNVLLQLMEMFDISPQVAQFCLNLEGNLENAITLLSTKEFRDQIVEMVNVAPYGEPKPQQTYDMILFLSQFNILIRLLTTFECWMNDLDSKCIVCSARLPFSSLKPSICDSGLCSFQYEEIGLGFDLETEIMIRPEVTDLLISLCYAAAVDRRLHLYPPQNVRVKGEDGAIFSGDGDWLSVLQTLDMCPSLSEMTNMIASQKLHENLNALNPKLIPLLKWVITSNRSHVRILPKGDQIPEISTSYQFILLSSSPAKELIFQRLKRSIDKSGKRPAIWAFHGSPAGNWHAILRLGLKNMSNTKEMLHGAVYGSGIYLAPDLNTSSRYARPTQSFWKKSIFGANWSCFAVCEVVNVSTLKSPSPYYVIPDEDIVSTRFLCIQSPQQSFINLDSKNLTIPKLVVKENVTDRKLDD